LFTGIVQGLCEVVALEDEPNLRRLSIDVGSLAERATLGASVAINGTCLTITAVKRNGNILSFDVIRETLGLTNLGALEIGDLVNVERSYRVGDEVGGHIVSGHITTAVTVDRIEEADNARDVFFRVDPQWMKYLPYKGFVALDGASLTIASVDSSANIISVSLIPETIARTSLGRVVPGDRVNLEVDSQTQAVVDTVERLLDSPDWRERLGANSR
jgi:riboflavin synthase